MNTSRMTAIALATTAILCGPAQAQQDKPTVGKYLADGYQVLNSQIGSPFLQFILHKQSPKGQMLVWCSVLLQNGETSSCRTIK